MYCKNLAVPGLFVCSSPDVLPSPYFDPFVLSKRSSSSSISTRYGERNPGDAPTGKLSLAKCPDDPRLSML